MPLAEWKRTEEIEEFVDEARDGVIFKHSTQCSVSDEAHREVTRFVEQNPDVPAYLVLVIESRPVSDAVGERLEVQHQSPQAIVVRDGRSVWDASHWEISAESLAQAWGAAVGD